MRTNRDFGIPLVAACALPACVGNPEPSADMVFQNGAVYTVDDGRSWSQAVAIRDGGIVYVGDDAGASAWVGAETWVVDLQGRMLMPGFHDAHTHVLLGGKGLRECSLFDLTDEDAIRARLFECRDAATERMTGSSVADGRSPPSRTASPTNPFWTRYSGIGRLTSKTRSTIPRG